MNTPPSLWRSANFRNLWASVVISTYGSLLRASAMIYAAIFLLQAPPAAIGVLRLAEIVPGFIIGLVAGVWVDRMRRRPILIATDLLRATLWIGVGFTALAAVGLALSPVRDVDHIPALPVDIVP